MKILYGNKEMNASFITEHPTSTADTPVLVTEEGRSLGIGDTGYIILEATEDERVKLKELGYTLKT